MVWSPQREVPNAFWWCSFYPMNFYDCVSYQTRALMSLFWQSPRCKCCCLRTLDIISSYGFRIFGEIVRLDPLVQWFLMFVYTFSAWKLSLINNHVSNLQNCVLLFLNLLEIIKAKLESPVWIAILQLLTGRTTKHHKIWLFLFLL